jgi:peroxiredoxin
MATASTQRSRPPGADGRHGDAASGAFSALVEDGVVKALNFEPVSGKGISATGAAMMLAQLKASAPAS